MINDLRRRKVTLYCHCICCNVPYILNSTKNGNSDQISGKNQSSGKFFSFSANIARFYYYPKNSKIVYGRNIIVISNDFGALTSDEQKSHDVFVKIFPDYPPRTFSSTPFRTKPRQNTSIWRNPKLLSTYEIA